MQDINQRLLAIETMLAGLCNKLSVAPEDRSLEAFIADRQSRGMDMVEIVKEWNSLKKGNK